MKQRLSDGREFIDAEFENPATIACDLTFPRNGDPLEGIVFKADSMDVKWGIYIYAFVFLFVRSWTGDLRYRATAEVSVNEIAIRQMEASADEIDMAEQAVYFLIGPHAMGRVTPHSIPRDTPNDPQQIGLLSFSMYGNRACYATFDDVTRVPIPRPTAVTG